MNPNQEQFAKVYKLDDYRKKPEEPFGPIAKGIVKRKADIQENLNSIDKERNEN